MVNKHFYVFHRETMLSGTLLTIFEPFEFDTQKKAQKHADFFHALSGINYQVTDSPCLPDL